MNVLVTGAAGFVGSNICHQIRLLRPSWNIIGFDNLSRIGSEVNIPALIDNGIKFIRGDVRCESDFEYFSDIGYVIDAAANPSVLAGTSGTGARQLIEQNLGGTVNTLEFCRKSGAGLVLLSSSRVYSIEALRSIPLLEGETRYTFDNSVNVQGLSSNGLSESFSTTPPLSLYGSTKLSSELLSLEYASNYGIPIIVNRCGVMSGEGQFGVPSQGIVAYWIAKALAGHDLVYTGQGGKGLQVRDLLHPSDLARLITLQMESTKVSGKIFNVSGGGESSFSLNELTQWCRKAGLTFNVTGEEIDRPNDVPYVVLDSTSVQTSLNWSPSITRDEIFSRVLRFLEANRNWLQVSGNA
jgi:CDP-paratose 2-epimerase